MDDLPSRGGYSRDCQKQLNSSPRIQHMTIHSSSVQREFFDLPAEGRLSNESYEFSLGLLSSRTFGWPKLLESDRVLIVSEAGMGKTYECQQIQKSLWNEGKAAFLVELAELAKGSLEESLPREEMKRYASWKAAQTERAIFLLDSIDELSLTPTSFASALKSIARSLGDDLSRACIILTTRPIAVDRELIREHLPVPTSTVISAEESFAKAAMRIKDKDASTAPPAWRYVALAPLSDVQMRSFALHRGVSDIPGLFEAIQSRNAQEFAKRPLDFFDLCNDWRDHGYIRSHRSQLDESIDAKLRGRADRRERTGLPRARARDGAARLALAMVLSRKLTVIYSRDDDTEHRSTALDPSTVLGEWNPEEIRALLERALFGFANYGRVRFHHRSAIEFLSAERIQYLRAQGLPDRTLLGLLSSSGPGGRVLIRPSMRATAAWLARDARPVRQFLLEHQPSILLHYGDPETLDITTRREALKRYVGLYGHGGWRGQPLPTIQVKRFASKDLADTIAALWSTGVSNPEVRAVLLELIGESRIESLANLCFDAATDEAGDSDDRFNALFALATMQDPRVPKMLDDVAASNSGWPLAIVPRVVLSLFPDHLSSGQLIGCLGRLESQKRQYGGISAHLPILLSESSFMPSQLTEIRCGLDVLVSAELSWSEQHHRVDTGRRDLVPALLVACRLESRSQENSQRLAESFALGCIVGSGDHRSDEDAVRLAEALLDAPDDFRESVLWHIKHLLEELAPERNRSAGSQAFFIQYQTMYQIRPLDRAWLLRATSDTVRDFSERSLALELAIEAVRLDGDGSTFLKDIEAATKDDRALLDRFHLHEAQVQNPSPDPEWIKENAQRQEAIGKKRELDLESWREFHRELLESTDEKFSPACVSNTLLNLWRAMGAAESSSSRAGWNRGFIERMFDKQMADRFRSALSETWRNEEPTLRSERPEADKNCYYRSWLIGLAGIYAEAEDSRWAQTLDLSEARLACRYALLELNRLPPWVDDLVSHHPQAVDSIIGSELAIDLRENEGSHVILLQHLSSASGPTAAHAVRRVREWLQEALTRDSLGSRPDTLGRALNLVLEHGSEHDRKFVGDSARSVLAGQPSEADLTMWLPILARIDVDAVVEHMERLSASTEPSKLSIVVRVVGALFGHQAPLRDNFSEGRPELLFRLLRVANRHVRVEDDEVHDGVFSPGARDNAEYGRSWIFGALMDAKGPQAWRIKLQLADDPTAERYRHRVEAIAEDKIAAELDDSIFSEKEIVRFERDFQFSPKTRREMAALLLSRLDDLDDLLDQDGSPRELWAGTKHERLLRREIARALRQRAYDGYVAVEEAVTADEKETDIRLVSKAAPLEAVIELKVGENGYSIADLEAALRDQLVGKYMAPEQRRVGALLISWAGKKTWRDPVTRKNVSFDDLVVRLNSYAQTLAMGLGDDSFLTVRGLRLAPTSPRFQ